MERILIIEDEKEMVAGLKFNFEARGYQVLTAFDGDEGYRIAVKDRPDLVILDIALPRRDGYSVCRALKQELTELPLIMLTARGQEADIVLGLELGADDYLTKPFSVLELMARIKAVLRRTRSGARIPESCRIGNVELNFKKYTATKKGKNVALSPREFELLKYFVERQGEVVSRDDLLNGVWGYNSFPNTRTVDTHIAKLRHKIEDKPDDPRHIVTIHGIGYKFLG